MSLREKKWMIVFLVFALQGCDALYHMLDKEAGEEKELIGEVVPFESNPTIEEIQSLLSLYGYNPGTVDGLMGVNTRKAVERFQKDHGLEVSGKVDQETWAQLKVFKANGLIVGGALNIPLVQEILLAAGCAPGKIDGKMGPKTKAAVRKFQKDNDLKVDGKIGYQTLSRLAAYLQPAETAP